MHFDPSEPATLVMLFITGVVLLKKFGEMDRYHDLRVLILTLFLSCIVLFFFLMYGLTAGNSVYADCEPEHFCTTEM